MIRKNGEEQVMNNDSLRVYPLTCSKRTDYLIPSLALGLLIEIENSQKKQIGKDYSI